MGGGKGGGVLNIQNLIFVKALPHLHLRVWTLHLASLTLENLLSSSNMI
jgi:hypothetical protein